MSKLYLHIGTHKTGTTAIQRNLLKQEKMLLKEGYILIDNFKIPKKVEISRATSKDDTLIKELHIYFQKYEKGSSYNYILVWEGFSGNPITFYNNRKIVFEILKESIPPHWEIEFLVFFRRQDQFIQSIYTQVKHQRIAGEISDILKIKYRRGFDWYEYIKDLQAVFRFSKINIHPYDSIYLKKNTIFTVFSNFIKSSKFKEIDLDENSNIGMSQDALRLYTSLTRKIYDKSSINLIRTYLQRYFNKGILVEYNYLTKEEKVDLLKFFIDSNENLKGFSSKFVFEKPAEDKLASKSSEKIEEEFIIYLLTMLKKKKKSKIMTRCIKFIRKQLNIFVKPKYK